MDTGAQSRPAVPPSSGVDARPVVLVLVDDTIGSLASLLLAAEIAGARRGRLHVAHVSPPPAWTGMAGLAGMPVPAGLLAEADHAVAVQIQDKAGDVLALGAPVEWTFTWTRAMPRPALDHARPDFGVIAS
jgi:hypothetical protein